AADQDVAFRRRIERFGFVLDRAGNQCRFATVTDARTAGPAYGNPAGFGQFEEALELPTPGPGDPAAHERNLRTRAGHGPRRLLSRGSSDAGRETLAWPKGFAVNLPRLDAPFLERGGEAGEEARGTANVEVAFAGNAELSARGSGQPADGVEVA